MSDLISEIKAAIESSEIDRARELLREALKQNPSAEIYYLASLAAVNEQQKKSFLQKAIEFDPFHKEANDELFKDSQPSVASNRVQPPQEEVNTRTPAANQLTNHFSMVRALVIAGIGCSIAGFFYSLDLSRWISHFLADFVSGMTIALALGQAIPPVRRKGIQITLGFMMGSILGLTIGRTIYDLLPTTRNPLIGNFVFNLFWVMVTPMVMGIILNKSVKGIGGKVFRDWFVATVFTIVFFAISGIDLTFSNMLGNAIFGVVGCYLTLREVQRSNKLVGPSYLRTETASNADIYHNPPPDSMPAADNERAFAWKGLVFGILTLALVIWAVSSSASSNKKESALVGRHPQQWMPKYQTFLAINDNLPLRGEFAYPGEKEGITSYGFNWHEPACSKAISSPVALGEVYVVLYENISDAQVAYSSYEPSFKGESILKNKQDVNLRTGNTGTISIHQYTSCDMPAYYAVLTFRRNNVVGITDAETFQEDPENVLRRILLDVGSQLDQSIQSEIEDYPGRESDLVAVSNSVRTIDLPEISNEPETAQSPANLGNPGDYIEGTLSCSAGAGFYKVGGVLNNTSDRTINIMVEWGASAAWNVMGTSYTRTSDTIVLWGGESRIVSLYGAPVIDDNDGSPHFPCEIYSQSTDWGMNP